MRFLYALVAVLLFSAPASAQIENAGLEDSLALQVIGSADITGTIYNYQPNLPGGYFPADPSVTLYIAPSYFQRTNADGTLVGTGTVITTAGVTGQGVFAMNSAGVDGVTSEGCTAAEVDNLSELAGKIVLIARGTCSFYVKFQVAEAAGAIGVVVYNPAYRTASDPNIVTGGLGGTPLEGEPNIGIPGVFVPVGIAQPIIDEITGGGTVTLKIFDLAGNVAAEAPVSTTNSGLVVRGANPFSFSTDLRVFTEQAEAVRVDVFNVRGQLVQTLFNGTVAGERAVTLTSADLAPGVYFVRATGETFTAQQQLTVVR